MRYHLISETIDGSIKNIIQLKTLDNSLEYSQMFDALCDTPEVFQNKLVQTLNSCGENMNCSPLETFNTVLCASEDDDSRKKMYNWWRGVFEILGKIDVPLDKQEEYNQKIDDVMAEILKTSSDAQLGDDGAEERENDGQLVSEEYENASKEDEQMMLNDMKFAIGKIGNIANKVQDLINFVNPYCESTNEVITKMTDNKDSEMFEIRKNYVLGISNDTKMRESLMNIIEDRFELKKTISDLHGLRDKFDELVVDADEGEKSSSDVVRFMMDNELCHNDAEAKEFAEEYLDLPPDDQDDSEKESDKAALKAAKMDMVRESAADFEIGDRVWWNDPDDDISSGEYTITDIMRDYDDEGEQQTIFFIQSDDGSEAEVMDNEIEPLEAHAREEDPEMGASDGGDEWVSIDDLAVANETTKIDDEYSYEDKYALTEEDFDTDELYKVISQCGTEDFHWDIWDKRESGYKLITREKGYSFIGSMIHPHKYKKYSSDIDAVVKSTYRAIEKWIKTIDASKLGELYPYIHGDFNRGNVIARVGVIPNRKIDDVEDEKSSVPNEDEDDTEMSEGTEVKKDDEVKADKKFKGDDGTVKTLDNAENKKVVSEMTIEQEVVDCDQLLNLLWGQGRANLQELIESGIASDDEILSALSDLDIKNLTAINDFIGYDFESLLESLGANMEVYDQSGRIMTGDEDDSED